MASDYNILMTYLKKMLINPLTIYTSQQYILAESVHNSTEEK